MKTLYFCSFGYYDDRGDDLNSAATDMDASLVDPDDSDDEGVNAATFGLLGCNFGIAMPVSTFSVLAHRF